MSALGLRCRSHSHLQVMFYLQVMLQFMCLLAVMDVLSATQEDMYAGDRVLRVETPTEDDWLQLKSVLTRELPLQDIDIWREPEFDRKSADVYVKGFHAPRFQKALVEGALNWSVMIDDISRRVHLEKQGLERSRRDVRRVKSSTGGPGQAVVGRFVRHHVIETWLKKMATTYPDITTLYNIGQSHEGRDMHVLRVGTGSGYQRAVWVDAGLHAREWVAPASAIYLIHKLLKNYKTDLEIRRYVTELSWYFLVVANPDGYEHTHTQYRFWRKNRRPMAFNCTGVDLNRNFGYMWGGADASPNPCNVVYRGPSPESEPEVKNMIRFLLPRRRSFVVYMSLHSYGQKLLGRWAYSNETLPDDHREQDTLAQRSVKAMTRQHQRRYETGTAASLMYPYSGGSADWAQGAAGIKYSYVTELRDEGVYGFLLPEEEIIPTGQEVWAGIRVFLRYITNNPTVRTRTDPQGATSVPPAPHTPHHVRTPLTEPSSAPSRPNPTLRHSLSNSSVKSLLVLHPSGRGAAQRCSSLLGHLIMIACMIPIFLRLGYV